MTLAKVAAIAGVSNATVSRVVNRQSGVSPKTASAVEAIMKQIGFVPPENRRGPKPNSRRTSREHRIALVVCGGDASNPNPPAGFVLLLQGIESALAKQDLHLNLVFAAGLDKVPPILANDPPNGVLMMRGMPTGEAEAFYRKIPAVWLMANPFRPQWGDQVMPNNETIGKLAADYLIKRGHKRLAFLNLRHANWHFDLRLAAFRAAAAAAGVHVDVLTETEPNRPNDANEGTRAAAMVKRLRQLTQEPTGLFIAEDSQMRYFHSLFLQNHMSIGEGIDLISCNRELPYLAGLLPASSSIDIRFDLIGNIGVERLLWRIENPNIPGRIITLVDPVLD